MQLIVGTVSETVEVTGASPADGNGTYHGLGDHAETGATADGQPVTDQQAKTFAKNRRDEKTRSNKRPRPSSTCRRKLLACFRPRRRAPAGASYRFARALVLDEETKVTFSNKTK